MDEFYIFQIDFINNEDFDKYNPEKISFLFFSN